MNSILDSKYAKRQEDVVFALQDWEGLAELTMDLDYRKLNDPERELDSTKEFLDMEEISYSVYDSPEPGVYHLRLVRENARLE